MSDTPYDVVLYQGDHATFEGQAVGSGGGSLPPTWEVNGAGGLQIDPTDDSEPSLLVNDAEGNALIIAATTGVQLNANNYGGLTPQASGDTYAQPTLAGHSAILADFAAGDSIVEVKDPGKLGFFGATPAVRPAVPLTTPSVQDVIDALVTLGLVAQHD